MYFEIKESAVTDQLPVLGVFTLNARGVCCSTEMYISSF